MSKLDLGTLVLGMEVDKGNWSSGLSDAMTQGDGFKGKFDGIGKFISGNWKTMMLGGVAAAGLAVGKFLIDCTGQAMEFEQQMSKVSTLLGGTEEEAMARTKELGSLVIDISNNTGVATETLTDGLYQVVSAFGDTADSATILEIATQGAAAGGATVTDSVNLLSAVTKGYGDTSAEANQKVSDMAFTAVKLGQTTFPELAGAMGSVVPLAESLGVKQEELFGVMATFTGVTGNASEVSTQFRGVLQAMMAPTKGMSELITELGYSNGEAMMESLGLQGSIDAITKKATESGTPLQAYIGSIEGQTLALAASGAQHENLTEKTKAMTEASGATTQAFDRTTSSAKSQYEMMKNRLGNSMTELGQSLLPLVTGAMQLLSPVIDGITWSFQKMGDGISWVIGKCKELWSWLSDSTIGKAIGKGVDFIGGLFGKSIEMPEVEASYAIGTNYVPHDMVAQIHEGEMIVPAEHNPYNSNSKNKGYVPGGVTQVNNFYSNTMTPSEVARKTRLSMEDMAYAF